MAIMKILKGPQDLAPNIFKTFCFKLTCDNAFLTTAFFTGKTPQIVLFTQYAHKTPIFTNSAEKSISCSFL